MRIATYNIHKCRGIDWRVDPDRVARVIREVDADIMALQEVVNHQQQQRDPRDHQGEYLALQTGLNFFCLGENRKHQGAAYGNVTLSRIPMLGHCNYNITALGREQRGCLRSDHQMPDGTTLHVFNVHFGTSLFERPYQAEKILDHEVLHNPELSGPRILLGDFNEWLRGRATRMLQSQLRSVDSEAFRRRPRTYPGVLPLVHLDHIYHDEQLTLTHFHVHRTRPALLASDHVPLVAEFEW